MNLVHKAVLACVVATVSGCAGMSQASNSSQTGNSVPTTAITGSRGGLADLRRQQRADQCQHRGDPDHCGQCGHHGRQQVAISAPIDAGLIYLSGVKVNGALHDVYFGTTNVGRTVAIDANEGKVLWEYAPPAFDEAAAVAGAKVGARGLTVKQITNSTPVADANRQFVYAASADGKGHQDLDR